MRLVIVTVGSDERILIRGIFKIGLSDRDVVMLVYSKSGGELEVEKVERAAGVLRDVIAKAGAKVVDVVVSGFDFYGDAATVVKAVRGCGADDVVAVLAGGMRMLIFEALMALLLLHRIMGLKAKVYVAREDGSYDAVLPVEAFYVSLSAGEGVVIRKLSEHGAVKRSKLVDVVSKETGFSESMVYKAVKSLVRKGLAALEGDSLKLTELGRLLYVASQ